MPASRNRAGGSRTAAKPHRYYQPYFGTKIAFVHLGARSRLFTVHSDLLCKSSAYFRRNLQENRKDVEGDCSICFDELDPRGQELIYCKTCGGNFHEGCLKRWLEQSRARKCPLCRGLWVDRVGVATVRLSALHQDDFQVYQDWLYSGKIVYQMSYDEAIQQDNFKLIIRTYLFSLYVEDSKFGTAILQAMIDWFENEDKYPDQDAIAIAYGTSPDPDTCHLYPSVSEKNMPGLHRLQRFLVDTYMEVAQGSWFEDEDWRTYPQEFLRDLAVSMFNKHPGKNKWNADTWKKVVEEEEVTAQDD